MVWDSSVRGAPKLEENRSDGVRLWQQSLRGSLPMTPGFGPVGMVGQSQLEKTIDYIVPTIFMHDGTRFREYIFRSTKEDADKTIHLVHTFWIDGYYL